MYYELLGGIYYDNVVFVRTGCPSVPWHVKERSGKGDWEQCCKPVVTRPLGNSAVESPSHSAAVLCDSFAGRERSSDPRTKNGGFDRVKLH